MKKLALLWEKIRNEPLLAALSGTFVLLLVLFLFTVFLQDPKWIYRYLGLPKKNDALKFLGIGMGGVLLALQALMAYKRAKALEDTANAQAEAAKAQAKATEEQAKANQNTEQGQRQERLKNAIEHLGHESVSVRLGGAYELFHLAEDTKELQQTALDILCAHIRQTTGESEYREKYKSKPSEEVQSLLTLLIHINAGNLTKAYLQGAHLLKAQLDGARLEVAQLQKADLTGAHLQGVILVKAHLQRAVLANAHLQGSILNEACLHRAILIATDLRYAGLNGTYLQGANLAVARLQKASLGGAYLQGAFLHMAQLHGAILTDAQLQGAYLRAAQLHEVQFSSLQGLQHLNETVRQEIDPQPAQLQGVSSPAVRSFDAFRERIRERKDKETDLSGVMFSGGLTKQNVDSLVGGLSEAGAKELRETLEPHIDQPVSHELPEDSGAITGAYTEEEAEQWIAEYEKAMSEVPTESDN